MTDDRRNWLCGVAALLLLMVAWDGEAKLNLAFEDRADPNPRQMQIAAEVAGLCLGLLVSWTSEASRN